MATCPPLPLTAPLLEHNCLSERMNGIVARQARDGGDSVSQEERPLGGMAEPQGTALVGSNFRQSSGLGWREEPLDWETQVILPKCSSLPDATGSMLDPGPALPPPWLAVTSGCLSPLSPQLPRLPLQGGGQSFWSHRNVGRTKQSTRHSAHKGEKLLSKQTCCSGETTGAAPPSAQTPCYPQVLPPGVCCW